MNKKIWIILMIIVVIMMMGGKEMKKEHSYNSPFICIGPASYDYYIKESITVTDSIGSTVIGDAPGAMLLGEDACTNSDDLELFKCSDICTPGTQCPVPHSGYMYDITTYTCPEGCLDGACISACNTDADTNCDRIVSDTELLSYANLWMAGSISDTDLLQAAGAWLGG